jgi:hypothetical protein
LFRTAQADLRAGLGTVWVLAQMPDDSEEDLGVEKT